ncbi:MAG TPA: 2Fe-2S iron-sulfur cluster-binding protein [Verrucomicrobiae bacterium]|nr:2Fe-2S iron-sulfur cluster-binding protein [Verrucomicrobiae bacterium]
MSAEPRAPADPLTVTIDGRAVEVAPGTLVWDACEKAGVFVPVYCAHKKMEPVAVCRMCLVEVGTLPKLQPACATVVQAGMEVRTATEKVRRFREGNLEFLLLNHPLDCPVCDRGGECDLQDFAQRYGPPRSRTAITGKVHFDKARPLSDRIMLDQERCILCWRCVRYCDEITGDRAIVLQERAVHTVVDTFEGRPLTGPFQGNLPEVCPVGALTHTDYRFRSRPWDLQRTPSICSGCSYGCNLGVDSRDDQVVRLVSQDNPDVDDSWLCDRGRYGVPDLNRTDRVVSAETSLEGPRRPLAATEAAAAASRALAGLLERHGPLQVACLGTSQMTNEEAFALQWLARDVIGTPHVDHQLRDWPQLSVEEFRLGIRELEECDTVVVLGERPEQATPVLTLRLRKAEHKCGREVRRVAADADPAPLAALVRGRRLVGVVAHETDRTAARELAAALAPGNGEVRRLTLTDGMNGRGCKDMGLLPHLLPGYQPAERTGMGGREILAAAVAGRLRALIVVGPNPELEAESGFEAALQRVELVIALTPFLGAISRQARALLPGRTIVEKQGTVTSSEGRVQRVRPALHPRLGAGPSELRLLIEIGRALGGAWDGPPLATPAFQVLATAVPAYRSTRGGLRAAWPGWGSPG